MSVRRQPYQFAAVLLFLCGLALPAIAENVLWGDEWDQLTTQPKVVTKIAKDDQGNITRDILVPDVLFVHQTRHKDGVEVITEDLTGHGAVLCTWSVYVTLSALLDSCFPEVASERELRGVLDESVSRINKFIVANNTTPITLQNLRERIARQKQASMDQFEGLSDDDRVRICVTDDAAKMLTKLREAPASDIRKSVDYLLAVPRPPVGGPCL